MGPEAAVTRPEQIAPQHGVPTLLVLGYRYSILVYDVSYIDIIDIIYLYCKRCNNNDNSI